MCARRNRFDVIYYFVLKRIGKICYFPFNGNRLDWLTSPDKAISLIFATHESPIVKNTETTGLVLLKPDRFSDAATNR